MFPTTPELQAISELRCPLCGNAIGKDIDDQDDIQALLILYCKNFEDCGIEIRRFARYGWPAMIEHWRKLKHASN